MQRQTVHFSGRVQGVGFRYTASRLAGGRLVAGYMRNLPDGRVELVAEGSEAEIDRLLRALRDHFGEDITDAAIQIAPATGEFSSFEVRR